MPIAPLQCFFIIYIYFVVVVVLFCFFVFRDRVSLCSPGCPELTL